MSDECACRKALGHYADAANWECPRCHGRDELNCCMCHWVGSGEHAAEIARDALAAPCQCEQLRADLKEALDALEPFGSYRRMSDDLKAELMATWPTTSAVFERAAGVFAKHRPAPASDSTEGDGLAGAF